MAFLDGFLDETGACPRFFLLGGYFVRVFFVFFSVWGNSFHRYFGGRFTCSDIQMLCSACKAELKASLCAELVDKHVRPSQKEAARQPEEATAE